MWNWQNPLPQGNGLRDIWGSSGSDIFCAGFDGTILHFDGTTWALQTSGTPAYLNGVWGFAGSPTFVVGDGGVILRHDGATWSSMTSGTTNPLNAVWGTSPSDVYAVLNTGYNGSTFEGYTQFDQDSIYRGDARSAHVIHVNSGSQPRLRLNSAFDAQELCEFR